MESIREKNLLFTRFLENKCTPDELHLLYELLSSGDNEKSFKEILYTHLSNFNDIQHDDFPVDFEKIYNKLLTEIKFRENEELDRHQVEKRNKVRQLILSVVSLAAIFCIAFFLGSLYRQNKFTGPVYSAANIFTEIKAPMGARSEIMLADGTEVMLNAGSSLKYRNDFNSINRDLILEGEAYFKVAKNLSLPLVVYAGNINIKATGTEFNVKAYSDEGIIETTLVKGEVEISQKNNKDKDRVLVLGPNQKAIYACQTDKLTLDKIKEIEPLAVMPAKIITEKLLISPKTDVDQVTAWTKKKLIIKSENLGSLCTKLQRKYDVAFIFRDEGAKKHRFSGVLLDETFGQVMDVIKLTAPVDYVLDGKTAIIFSNKKETDKSQKNLK